MCVMFLLCHSFTWKVSYNSFKVFPSHWEGNILSCQGVRELETILCIKFIDDSDKRSSSSEHNWSYQRESIWINGQKIDKGKV